MIEILILLGLILVNGVFSMAEISLVSARKSRLESQASRGDENAKRALHLSNRPDTLLSTVQIGITLIGVFTGIFSGESLKGGVVEFLSQFKWVSHYANGLATVIIVIILTYFSIVLGELVPKRIGLSSPEAIAKILAGPMQVVSKVTQPFIWLLNVSSTFLINLFNIKNNDNQVTEDEIKAIINEGTEHGAIEEAEQEIIERVFRLGDRNITSLMTHRSDIVWFDINTTLEEVRSPIREMTHAAYPLCDKNIDDIRGIITLKELIKADPQTKLGEVMKPALYVPENNTPYQILEKFKQSKIHACFIVDEYGTLLGMITLNDILEAIVGDMPEVDNQDDYEIITREDGTFLVDGQISYFDFMQHFNKVPWIDTADQEYDTLAGFILHILERIPHTGDKMEWRGFTFEIIDMDGHRIDKVLVNIHEDIRNDMEEDNGDL